MDQKKSSSLGAAGGILAFATALAVGTAHGGGAPRIVLADSTRAAKPPPAVISPQTGMQLVQRFLQQRPDSAVCGGGSSAPACYDFDVVIATVPDPDDSHLDWAYDANLEALQKAFEADGYALDRFWLPWGDPAAGASPEATANRDDHPGVLLFRGEPARAGGPPRMRLLYLVGEVPTSGVHANALLAALAERAALLERPTFFTRGARADTIKIVGPTFSGSARSLRTTLDTWARAVRKARAQVLEGARPGAGPAKGGGKPAAATSPGPWVSIVTGSATRDDNAGVLADSPRIVFRSAVHSLKDYGAALTELGGSLGLHPHEIAILEESGTLYGGARIDRDDSLLHISLPMNISGVRDQADGQVHSTQGGSLTALLQSMHASPVGLSLKGGARPRESPRPVSDLTPASTGILLDELIRTLEKNRIRAVGLQFTDVRDNLFLAREVRQHLHDVQLFTFDANALYLRPDRSESLNGMLVFSSYPMMVESQDWGRTRGSTARRQQLFASAGAEGSYNAALMQLGAMRQLVDYAWPVDSAGTRFAPPVWVLAVGANSFVPVRVVSRPGTYVSTVSAAELLPHDPGPAPAAADARRQMPCALPRLSTGCPPSASPPALAVAGAATVLVLAVVAALHSLVTLTERALPLLMEHAPEDNGDDGRVPTGGRAGEPHERPLSTRFAAHRLAAHRKHTVLSLTITFPRAIFTGQLPPPYRQPVTGFLDPGRPGVTAAQPAMTAAKTASASSLAEGAAAVAEPGEDPRGDDARDAAQARGDGDEPAIPPPPRWKQLVHEIVHGTHVAAGLAEQERRVHAGSLLLHREIYLAMRLVALGGMLVPVSTLLLPAAAPRWMLAVTGVGAAVVWLAAMLTGLMLGLVILVCHHRESREYALRQDRRRGGQGWPWYVEISGRLGVLALAVVYTGLNVWLFDDLRRAAADPLTFALLRQRLMNGASGVSPVVPLLLIGAGLLAWCTWQLARIRMLSEITTFEDAFLCRAARGRQREGDAAVTVALVERIARVRSALFLLVPRGQALGVAAALALMLLMIGRRFEPTLENAWLPAHGTVYDLVSGGLHVAVGLLIVTGVAMLAAHRRKHLLAWLAGGSLAAILVAAWLGPRLFQPWIRGRASFDLLLAVGVLGTLSATVWGVYRLMMVWSALQTFLKALEATPLLGALDRVPARISRLARLTLYGSTPQQTIDSSLGALWRRLRDLHRVQEPILAELLPRQSRTALAALMAQDAWPSRAQFWSRRRVGIPFAHLYNVTERLWSSETSEGALARLHLPEPGADHVPEHGRGLYVGFPEGAREFVQVLEDFLALQVVDYVQWVLEALHKLAMFLFASLLIGTALLSTYPFAAQSTARVVFVFVMLATVGSLLTVMVQTNRDEVLSRIAGTTPGRITWDSSFVFNGLLLGLAPLLALVSSEFPGMREIAFAWLSPVVKLLGGG